MRVSSESPTFPAIAAWSRGRVPGIMEGWPGWAWAWLQLVRAGLVPFSRTRSRAIHRELSRRLDGIDVSRGDVSLVKGIGAYAVVIAAAATVDEEFFTLLPRMFDAWIRSCELSQKIDVYSGVAGALLAAAEIEAYLPKSVPRPLVELAHRRLVAAAQEAVLPRAHRSYLGFAHGYAGDLFALEMARSVFKLATPRDLLSQMLGILERSRCEAPDGAAFWSAALGEERIQLTAWCNGSAGIALALLGCQRFGIPGMRSRYRNLALRALRATEYRIRSGPTFCCGTIGRAQVLIEAYRQLGDPAWARSALTIARTIPVDGDEGRRHFRNGTLGTIYLRWRLAHPTALPFPAFANIGAFVE